MQNTSPSSIFALKYRGADKSLARPTSRCILFDGENILFDASLVIYIYTNSTNIPPIMIINRIYELKENLVRNTTCSEQIVYSVIETTCFDLYCSFNHM